ncbi:MAG TPA: hypothetical protein VFZ18_05470 [Longimicrobiaceae bacterium]
MNSSTECCAASAPRLARVFGSIALVAALANTSGCAAAVGAAMAADRLQRGLAGVRQLVANSRPLESGEVDLSRALASPLAGTYRAVQVLGNDTVHYYLRTTERPTAPIMDEEGNLTGHVLPGIAAATLDTLEARVSARSAGTTDQPAGHALFLIEGTQVPDPNARTLYPAAFLGRVAPGESDAADAQAEALLAADLAMDAPALDDLEGQGIPHELFDSVAEGIFTLTPEGAAVYHQDYEMEDGRTLTLHFERISATTLPAVEW